MSELIWANDSMPRIMRPLPVSSRHRCRCGCRTRATHTGLAVNGLRAVALTDGCEMHVRRWVHEGQPLVKP